MNDGRKGKPNELFVTLLVLEYDMNSISIPMNSISKRSEIVGKWAI